MAASINDLLEILKKQQDPTKVYMIGLEDLRVLIDQSDSQAATMLEAYMDAFPGASMAECVTALNSALFWMMLVMTTTGAPEGEEVPPGEPVTETTGLTQ